MSLPEKLYSLKTYPLRVSLLTPLSLSQACTKILNLCRMNRAKIALMNLKKEKESFSTKKSKVMFWLSYAFTNMANKRKQRKEVSPYLRFLSFHSSQSQKY